MLKYVSERRKCNELYSTSKVFSATLLVAFVTFPASPRLPRKPVEGVKINFDLGYRTATLFIKYQFKMLLRPVLLVEQSYMVWSTRGKWLASQLHFSSYGKNWIVSSLPDPRGKLCWDTFLQIETAEHFACWIVPHCLPWFNWMLVYRRIIKLLKVQLIKAINLYLSLDYCYLQRCSILISLIEQELSTEASERYGENPYF